MISNYARWIASFALVLIVCSVSSAQETTTVRITKNGKTVSLAESLTVQDGKKYLVIAENEAVTTALQEGVTLRSSNPQSVAVLNGNILVGVGVDSAAVITARRNDQDVPINGLAEFSVRVVDRDNGRQIVAQSTFLPFKTVRDNFGKKFAMSYFVVQVDIRNEKEDQQFIVQTIDVLIDPNQCERGVALYYRFDETECRNIFDTYFQFPSVQQGIRREEVIAVGKADLNRSKRNVGFRILGFTAAMGTILTGFNGVLGPDGVKGVNVLGTTVSAAANGLFPDNAAEKLDNLRNALPTEDVIIKSKESRTFNVFIPTERVFWTKSWRRYIRNAKESDFDTYKLKSVLDLFLLSSATGVLVDNDAPKVQVKSDDNARNQVAKFQLGELPKSFLLNAGTANDVLDALSDALAKAETRDNAQKSLRNILEALMNDPEIGPAFALHAKEVTLASEGKVILPAIRKVREGILESEENDNADLVNKFNEIVVRVGK